MIIESREREQIELRHLAVKRGPIEDCIVWWYGAVFRNFRDRTLPLVAVSFRKLLPNGSLGSFIRIDVGITELALLQLGTIWREGLCRSQLVLEERVVKVDFSPGKWRYASQASTNERFRTSLIPPNLYPLHYGVRDRTELIMFDMGSDRRLLVPSLEFFSRCYGRSAEVNRVLSTYPWSDAELRLHQPHTETVPAGLWSVNLPANIHNANAMFVAHVKYDDYAKSAAKRIYSDLETQFDGHRGLAFPQIGPWFVGPAKLIVQGIELDRDQFLALRIVGGSEPKGPHIWSFRVNPGEADNPAPDGAPQSSWTGGGHKLPSNIPSLTNITPTNPAGHAGDIVEVLNPTYRIVGKPRTVIPQKLHSAKTRPGSLIPSQESDKHSPGERQGASGTTGVASIHTETQLDSQGAALDVWDALQYLHETCPQLIEDVGWYSPELDAVNFIDKEPGMVALLSFDKERMGLPNSDQKWVYLDAALTRIRGVLIAFVKTPKRSAYIFEIERRSSKRTAENGNTYAKEQAFCGLIVSPSADTKPSDWIPNVLRGILLEQGIMARVAKYCPDHLVNYYRRSSSKGDEITGHSTVIAALGKVNIDVPHPKHKVGMQGAG